MPPVTSLRRIPTVPTVGRPQLSPPPRNMTVTSPPQHHHQPHQHQVPHHGHERSASASSAVPPYMVALAGWPEPVFIAEARDAWEKKHSRPPSPVGGNGSAKLPPLSTEFREGVRLPDRLPPHPPRAEAREGVSAGGGASGTGAFGGPSAAAGPSASAGMPSASASASAPRSRASSPSPPSFPTSSARTTSAGSPKSAGSSPRGAGGRSLSPPQYSSPSHAGYVASAHAAHQSAHARAAAAARSRTFQDPRYNAGAAVVGVRGGRVALRVAPSWASAGGDATPAAVLHKRMNSAGRAMRPPPPPAHQPQQQREGRDAEASASASARHTLGEPTHGRLMDPRYPAAQVLLRATPEVFPQFPVAHEVYPRDPEHWKGSPGGGSPESMEVDH